MRRSIEAGLDPRYGGVAPPGRARTRAGVTRTVEFMARPIPAQAQVLALTGALRDLALQPADDLDIRYESLRQFGHPCHYRMDFEKSFATGFVEFCGIADGFYVTISDVSLAAPYWTVTSAANMVRIMIASNVEGESEVTGEGPISIKGPGVTIAIDPGGAPPTRAVMFGYTQQAQVMIHRDALAGLFVADETGQPAVIRALLAGTLERKDGRFLPLGSGFLRCLQDLHGCTLEGASRRLYIRAKAIEIISHAFEALAREDRQDAAETTATTTRGVLKAQRLLAENFIAPPSLDDLAHQVGLSRTALCVGFRQIVGQTVFDYIADLRMQQALELLRQRKTSIAHIAHAVGFTHTSSFSVAVQRRFGATPSELRRGHTPAT